MTNIKKLDTNLVSINQLSFINNDAINYEIEYSEDYDNTYPLYLFFNDVDANFLCADRKKYFVFAPTDKNERVLENYKKLWNEVKEEIRTIKRGIEPFEYEKGVTRIEFESDNGLPLGKILNIPACIIIDRFIFEKNDKFYPQVYLKHCCLEFEHADNSYVCCKTLLKLINNSEYGKYLSKKQVVNFVTSDFNSL